jgi:hypothetical protein
MAGLPLLTIRDVEDRLGRTVTDSEALRLYRLIEDVTAVITDRVGNDLTNGTGEQETFDRHESPWIVLNRWPISNVVVTGDGAAVTPAKLDTANGWLKLSQRYTTIVVDYDYGYDTAPAALKAIAAQIVGRAFGRPSEYAGVTSETTGPYNFQIGSAAAAGAAGMLNAEADALDKVRRRLPYGAVATVPLGAWVGGYPEYDPWANA